MVTSASDKFRRPGRTPIRAAADRRSVTPEGLHLDTSNLREMRNWARDLRFLDDPERRSLRPTGPAGRYALRDRTKNLERELMNRDDRMVGIPWKTSLCLLLLVAAILAGCGGGTSVAADVSALTAPTR
jgi:hypothetical protein